MERSGNLNQDNLVRRYLTISPNTPLIIVLDNIESICPLHFTTQAQSNMVVPQKLHSVQRIRSNKQSGEYWFPCVESNAIQVTLKCSDALLCDELFTRHHKISLSVNSA